jgi:hypothetical protein
MNKGIFTVAVCAGCQPKDILYGYFFVKCSSFFSGAEQAVLDGGCTMIGIFPDNLLC